MIPGLVFFASAGAGVLEKKITQIFSLLSLLLSVLVNFLFSVFRLKIYTHGWPKENQN